MLYDSYNMTDQFIMFQDELVIEDSSCLNTTSTFTRIKCGLGENEVCITVDKQFWSTTDNIVNILTGDPSDNAENIEVDKSAPTAIKE